MGQPRGGHLISLEVSLSLAEAGSGSIDIVTNGGALRSSTALKSLLFF